MTMPPNNSPEPPPIAFFGSAFAVDSYGGAAQLWSLGGITRNNHRTYYGTKQTR